MKEATEFGIKYLQVMPDGHQEYVMHKVVWRSRVNAEKALELLKGVVACPVLVEIWDPVEIEALNEEADDKGTCPADCLGVGKAKEPLPEPEPEEYKDLEQPKENPTPVTKWSTKQITCVRHPDGMVTVTEDGKDVSDPEQRKKLQESLGHVFDDFLDLPFPVDPIHLALGFKTGSNLWSGRWTKS